MFYGTPLVVTCPFVSFFNPLNWQAHYLAANKFKTFQIFSCEYLNGREPYVINDCNLSKKLQHSDDNLQCYYGTLWII